MKANQLNLKQQNFNFSAQTKTGHYKSLMKLGLVLPSTKAQAKHFISTQTFMDVFNAKDVEVVEALMNKHGFEGEYKYTKSNKWVRLQNISDLKAALKAEYLN